VWGEEKGHHQQTFCDEQHVVLEGGIPYLLSDLPTSRSKESSLEKAKLPPSNSSFCAGGDLGDTRDLHRSVFTAEDKCLRVHVLEIGARAENFL
jgi:hypothetical protein